MPQAVQRVVELRLREGDADGPLAELRALPEELRGTVDVVLGAIRVDDGDRVE